jgi:hypothetical protein
MIYEILTAKKKDKEGSIPDNNGITPEQLQQLHGVGIEGRDCGSR